MFDRKVIALHQWVVDESERQPAWWAENSAWLFSAIGLVAHALSWRGGAHIVIAAIGLGIGVYCILSSRSPAMLAATGASFSSRAIFWAFIVMHTGALLLSPSPWKAASVLSELFALSYLYFAACLPPRPRQRRQASAQGGAA